MLEFKNEKVINKNNERNLTIISSDFFSNSEELNNPHFMLKYYDDDKNKFYLSLQDSSKICRIYQCDTVLNAEKVFKELINFLIKINNMFISADKLFIREENDPRFIFPKISNAKSNWN